MNELQEVIERLARASFQGSIPLMCLLVLCRLFPSVPARVQCWLWRLAFANLLLLLIWNPRIPVRILPAPPTQISAVEKQEASPVRLAAPHPNFTTHPPAKIDVEPKPYLALLWMSGVALMLFSGALHLFKAQRIRHRAVPVSDPSIHDLVSEIAGDLKIRSLPAVAAHPELPLPLLLGPIRPVLVLPAVIVEKADESALRVIIAHELAHHSRDDLSWNILPALAQALFFFHPLVWFARREYHVAQEIATDHLAIGALSSRPGDYASQLLGIIAAAKTRPAAVRLFSAGIVENHKTIKRRIHSMKFIDRTPRRRLVTAALVLTGILSLLPFRIAGERPSATPTAETKVKPPAAENRGPAKDTAQTAARPARLSALRPGVVKNIYHREGQPVKKGDLLIQIDDDEVHARLRTAHARFQLAKATLELERAELRRARSEFEMKKKLLATGAVHESELPDPALIEARQARAEAEFALAESQYFEAQLELGRYQIHSPRDGVILQLEAEEGEFVIASPERPIIVVGAPEGEATRQAALRRKLDVLENEQREMAKRYRDKHPTMVELAQRITALQKAVQGEPVSEVHVLGQVKSPGNQPFSGERLTILGAISRAGGLADRANRGKIKFTRPGETNRTYTFDDLKEPANQFPLEHGDIIEVADKLL